MGYMTNDGKIKMFTGVLFQVTLDGLARRALNQFKRKYDPEKYLDIIRADIKKRQPTFDPKTITKEDHLFSYMDLGAWLDLMLEYWDEVFREKLGETGRERVQNLRSIHRDWTAGKALSIDEACSVAQSTIYLLDAFQAQRLVQQARDILHELSGSPQPVSTTPAALPTAPAVPPSPSPAIPQIPEPPRHDPLTNGSATPVVPYTPPPMQKSPLGDADTARVTPPDPNAPLCVEVVEPGGKTRQEPLPKDAERIIVGRSGTSQICINDARASRVHLLLQPDGAGGLLVTDLQSANGTTLNGQRLPPNTPTAWRVGAPLILGSTWLILRKGCA
jgi:hypothetical protein